MFRPTLILLLLAFCFPISEAQAPKRLNPSEIHDAVQKLNTLASVLYLAAHPDDENTRLISYMANHEKARTAYLSITRGDGGQNLIGPELRELLGVIRTQELLAARRVDGGEQMFTRANDFGYSKHPDETLAIWEKDEVLGDVVWAIRQFKPDIIINRFDHRRAGRTHGHHTSSAMLGLEAFDLAADKSKFPEQLNYTETWQPKRIFFNTSWWFYGSQENFEKADKSNMMSFDVGVYYPSKGMSNNEIASLASSQHLCQGFGRPLFRGSQTEYVEFLEGDKPENGDIFSGIDTSWNRVEGGAKIEAILKDIENNFNFKDPASHLPELMQAYQLINNLSDEQWREVKSKEIKDIIQACAGLYLEVSASTPTASPGSNITLNIEALNRSDADIQLKSYKVNAAASSEEKNIVLKNNDRQNIEQDISIPSNMKTSGPYWLNQKGSLGMYKVDDRELIGKPETPAPLKVFFDLEIEGSRITLEKDVVYRYSQPDKGELYRPFEIIPAATAKLKEKVYIFEKAEQREVEVIVRAGKDNLVGTVSMAYPNDWEVYPRQQKVEISRKDDTETVVFTIIPPKETSEGLITPMVEVDGEIYTRELVEIDYSHIPFQTVLLPSESKLARISIQKLGENIGYIEGAGDVVPESLRQIGYNVINIAPEDITPENLNRFDAIVVGIRAYNVVDALKFKQQILFDYVANGGNMIVQYNTSRRVKVDQLAPYELQLSRDRVTDENAEVRFVDPSHSLLNYPNKITKADFNGWVQERGLYFPSEWGQEFTPVLSLNDPGESPKEGSLLVAKHGKGHYIYTGLSFFREFPAGVPGAYRLFANMLSIGKSDIKLDKKLND